MVWGRTHKPSHRPPSGHWNVEPGTTNHLIRDKSPVRCRQSSMYCQYRAYSAGGSNGSAPKGARDDRGSAHAATTKTSTYFLVPETRARRDRNAWSNRPSDALRARHDRQSRRVHRSVESDAAGGPEIEWVGVVGRRHR